MALVSAPPADKAAVPCLVKISFHNPTCPAEVKAPVQNAALIEWPRPAETTMALVSTALVEHAAVAFSMKIPESTATPLVEAMALV